MENRIKLMAKMLGRWNKYCEYRRVKRNKQSLLRSFYLRKIQRKVMRSWMSGCYRVSADESNRTVVKTVFIKWYTYYKLEATRRGVLA